MASGTYLFPTSPAPAPTDAPAFLHAWLPVGLLLALFSLESTAMLGADHTSIPLLHFTHAITRGQASVDTHWSMLHHIILKTGHFLGYGTLSLAWLRALLLHRRPGGNWRALANAVRMPGAWRLQLAAIALTFAIAGLDELHQSFLPNRTGKFSDVLLDTAGALVLQSLLRLGVSLATLARKPRLIQASHPGAAAA